MQIFRYQKHSTLKRIIIDILETGVFLIRQTETSYLYSGFVVTAFGQVIRMHISFFVSKFNT